MSFKVLAVFGTRPEAIKMAPVVQELKNRGPEIEVEVAVTAQHREMLDQVLELFRIEPDYDLNIMQPGQTLTGITSRALEGLEGVLQQSNPQIVLVHGDTTTTFAAALAAYYRQIPVGHVEAGLRTGNKYAPYPEEMNRRLAGHLSDLHFAPTKKAKENLLHEGIPEESIFVTGNTVIDALLKTVSPEFSLPDELEKIINTSYRIILVTAHRRENWGKPLENIFSALKDIVSDFEDVQLIYPVHLNPRVSETAAKILGDQERVHLIKPLDYAPFVNLMHKSYLVLTDSGGMQEEAPSLGKPVLVLRQTTERPEAVEAGTVKLVGTDRDEIYNRTSELLTKIKEYKLMSNAVNPYGDGKASKRLAEALLYFAGLKPARPDDFLYSSI